MKTIIAVIDADLELTPLGTRSRLEMELCARPVLRRTVERLGLVERIHRIFVLCPAAQADACTLLLHGLNVFVRRHDGAPSPWQGLVQSARKWSLDSWRGGIGGTTYFDEFTNCRRIAAVLDSAPADWVLSVPASAAQIDPILATRMIEHLEADENDSRLCFVQAPPGMAGILLDARLVRELSEKNAPLGWLFSYKPENPRKDLVFESCCCPTPVDLRHAGGRLLADTQRATKSLNDLWTELSNPDAAGVGRWLLKRDRTEIDPLPREVEIELTTDDPYPETRVRPRGQNVSRRGPLPLGVVQRVARELSAWDDSLVVLGGLGDPLRHPDFSAILGALRPQGSNEVGVFGLAVRTTAVDLTDSLIDALIACRVDVLNVLLDAWTPELYARLHTPGADAAARSGPAMEPQDRRAKPSVPVLDPPRADLAKVIQSLDRLTNARQRCRSVHPILVPEFTKYRENLHELDEFYDGWLRRAGAVTIGGFSHFARQFEDRSVMKMSPATRAPCRRIQSRCLILADGRVTFCDQDIQGRYAVGWLSESPDNSDAGSRSPDTEKRAAFAAGKNAENAFLPPVGSLQEAWRGSAFAALRQAHQSGRFDPNPICGACEDWHRA